jgi:hypothetical protein
MNKKHVLMLLFKVVNRLTQIMDIRHLMFTQKYVTSLEG